MRATITIIVHDSVQVENNGRVIDIWVDITNPYIPCLLGQEIGLIWDAYAEVLVLYEEGFLVALK
jgi:hypothetical protein